MGEASEGDFCRVIVITVNCGSKKGQVFLVFDSTHLAFYLSLVLKSRLGHIKPSPPKWYSR